MIRGYRRVVIITFVAEAVTLALGKSAENHHREGRKPSWEREEHPKTKRTWGYKSILSNGRSKQRPITSKRWVRRFRAGTIGVLRLQGGEK